MTGWQKWKVNFELLEEEKFLPTLPVTELHEVFTTAFDDT